MKKRVYGSILFITLDGSLLSQVLVGNCQVYLPLFSGTILWLKGIFQSKHAEQSASHSVFYIFVTTACLTEMLVRSKTDTGTNIFGKDALKSVEPLQIYALFFFII